MILLFVKAPERGRIKTRLARNIGEDAALTIYKLFVVDVVGTLKKGDMPFRIWFSPANAGAAMKGWLGGNLEYRAQSGKDLGERMENAFVESFREKFEKVVIIGGDIPDLTNTVIDEAFSSLEVSDAVIGPAHDGGYYLIGFRKSGFLRQAFHDIPWGSTQVFCETIKILDRWGCRVHLLPEWRDIDTIGDLESLYRNNVHTGFRESQTMSFIEENKERLFRFPCDGGK
jgi:rSAM/selenodomain-associated transferase 1